MNHTYSCDEHIGDLTKKDVWITFAYAVLRVFLSAGWIYLLIDNAVNREGILSNIIGATFGLWACHYIYETVQWWKRWWRERKQIAEKREKGVGNG